MVCVTYDVVPWPDTVEVLVTVDVEPGQLDMVEVTVLVAPGRPDMVEVTVTVEAVPV